MISEKALFLFSNILRDCCHWNLLPFEWDVKDRRLTVLFKWQKLAPFYLTSCYVVVNTSYVLISYFLKIQNEFVVNITFIIHTLYASTYLFNMIAYHGMFRNRYLIADVVNQLFATSAHVSGTYATFFKLVQIFKI